MQPHKSVTERLSDFANYHLQARNSDINKKQIQGKSLSVPLNNNLSFPSASSASCVDNYHRKQTLCRTTSNAPNAMQTQQQQQQHLMPPNLLQLGQHHQPQQYRLSPQQALSASTSPTNNKIPHLHQQQQQFSKSHSIDNLPREMFQPHTFNNSLWNQQADASKQHDSSDMSLNLHKKLQRQLSLLNPFDPRLYPMQQYHDAPHMVQLPSPPTHKSLSTSHSLSGGMAGQNQGHSIYEHQVSEVKSHYSSNR